MKGVNIRQRGRAKSFASLNQAPDDGDFASYVEELTQRSAQNAAAEARATSLQQAQSSSALDSDDWGRDAFEPDDSAASPSKARAESARRIAQTIQSKAESKVEESVRQEGEKLLTALRSGAKQVAVLGKDRSKTSTASGSRGGGALRIVRAIKWFVFAFVLLSLLSRTLQTLLK